MSGKASSGKNSLEDLARAVLGAAIFTSCYKDVDNTHTPYNKMDGTKLPAASGFNVENAALSYMSHGGTFSSPTMDDKVRAIELYIERNILNSDENTNRFLSTIVQKLNKE